MANEVPNCDSCFHHRVCPVLLGIEKFLSGFGKFWVPLKVQSKEVQVHPVGKAFMEGAASNCKHYGKDSEDGPSLVT